MDGKLAGINGRINTRYGAKANTGIGISIPAVQIQRFLPQLKAAGGGRVYHGFIRGIVLKTDEDGERKLRNGAEIKDIKVGALAEKLGFQKGDRITYVENYKLMNYERYLGVVGTFPGGSELTIKFDRGGVEKSVKATLETLNPGTMGVEFKRPRSGSDELVVDAVHAKLAGETAGLKAGDIITECNGKPTPNWSEWFKIANALDLLAGEKISVKVRRGDKADKATAKELLLTLTLSSSFDEPKK